MARRRRRKMTKAAKAARRRYLLAKKHGPKKKSYRSKSYRSKHPVMAGGFNLDRRRPPEWIFNWEGGGFHAVEAWERNEALRKMYALAKSFNEPHKPGYRILVPLANTLHKAAPGESERLGMGWD